MRIYLVGAVGALIVIAVAALLFQAKMKTSSIVNEPGHLATLDQMEKDGVPKFSLPLLLESGEFSSESVNGKIVLINFWASWCNPCVQEFPSLLKLIEKFPNDIELVAISADENKDEALRFIKTLSIKGSNVHLLWDPSRKVADPYGVQRIPESYVVGRNGKLIRKIVGVEDWAIPQSFEFFGDLVQKKQ